MTRPAATPKAAPKGPKRYGDTSGPLAELLRLEAAIEVHAEQKRGMVAEWTRRQQDLLARKKTVLSELRGEGRQLAIDLETGEVDE